jgi:hypothetical protein
VALGEMDGLNGKVVRRRWCHLEKRSDWLNGSERSVYVLGDIV